LSIYNDATLRLLARRGARRWVAPVELPLAIVAALAELRPANMEVEMFAYGRLPLAFSARCFTARAHRRAADSCGFICSDFPDGITIYSRHDQPLLTLNGIQTQSAAVYNLLPHIHRLRNAGVDVLRLSPQSRDFMAVIESFHDALDRGIEADFPPPYLPGGYCSDYL
jgi:collagenase-like PrtC family protease